MVVFDAHILRFNTTSVRRLIEEIKLTNDFNFEILSMALAEQCYSKKRKTIYVGIDGNFSVGPKVTIYAYCDGYTVCIIPMLDISRPNPASEIAFGSQFELSIRYAEEMLRLYQKANGVEVLDND